MFGRYFGARYFGRRYFGPSGAVVVAAPAARGFWVNPLAPYAQQRPRQIAGMGIARAGRSAVEGTGGYSLNVPPEPDAETMAALGRIETRRRRRGRMHRFMKNRA